MVFNKENCIICLENCSEKMLPNTKYSFILLILSEILLYLKMKDNLFTNIIQIFI